MHVIKGATLYTMAEAGVTRADIAIDGGKIAAIAETIDIPGAEVIDAAGMVVTPGFVDAHSHVGGFGGHGEQQDLNELTTPRTPELDALYGIDPTSEFFERNLEQGITTSCLVPGSGNVIGGWGIVLKSAGDDRLIKHPAVLKAATGINPKGVYSKQTKSPMTRMSIIYLLRSYLRDVQDYLRRKEEAAADPEKQAPEFDLGLEHGIPVLKKEIPLKAHTYMHDMTQVVEIARDFDIEVTIDHAQGASDFYDTLSDPHVRGVIFGPTAEPLFPGEGGKLDPECCAGLDERGIPVAVMTDGTDHREEPAHLRDGRSGALGHGSRTRACHGHVERCAHHRRRRPCGLARGGQGCRPLHLDGAPLACHRCRADARHR